MENEYSKLANIKKFLKSGEEIPHELMLAALNEVTDTMFSDRKRAIVASLSESAGRYLESWALMDFISAKITDEEVTKIIAARKTLTSRFSMLLPSIVALLNISDLGDVASAVSQIHDCCRDYPFIENSQYSTQQRKKIVREINSLIGLAAQLDDALGRAGTHVEIDFKSHKAAVKRTGTALYPLSDIDELRSELQMLRFASQLALYRDQAGEPSFYVGDNKARTHIVEYAYRMALQFEAPRFKTTPGSDFSTLCSLMFELATGAANESLAGAIIRFGRSDLKREIDKDEEIGRYENSDEGIAEREADNFANVKQQIENLEAEEQFWRNMISSGHWDEISRYQIELRFRDVLEEKERAMKHHGPFLVWASQISGKTMEEWRTKIDRSESEKLELAIEVGKRIRAKRG